MPQQPTPADTEYMKAHIHEDHRPLFIGINAACLVVACMAVALRFLSRWKISARIGLDDWLISLAMVFVIGHVSCLFITVRFGMARHSVLVTDVKGFALTSIIAQAFYNLGNATTKLSILSLYSRIFNRAVGWFNPTINITVAFVVLYTIPQVFTYIFQCVPVDSLWTQYGPDKQVRCINFKAVIITFGIINIVTDWFILLLPIPVVLSLRLDRRSKWSICSLFLVGAFVCVFSIVRLMFAKHVETVDPAWDYAPIATVSTVEAAAGILAACMPTWRPLFKFFRSEVSAYFSSSGSKNDSNPNALAYGNNSSVESKTKRKSKGRFSLRAHSKTREGRHNDDTDILVGGKGEVGLGLSDLGSKRSETSMSGESGEKVVRGKGVESGDVERGYSLNSNAMANSGAIYPLSPEPRQVYTYDHTNPQAPYQAGFGESMVGYVAQAGVVPKEGRGAGYGNARVRGESVEQQGKGGGMGGIVVTKTISSVERRVR
ncbi:hypothetical protein P154DRAFT_623547 [Amniculicola lignicola CBS 123094]|uniref:Rhodopsin domain-containing protein n=1 Tax=Amniculicola lignicola CBS 123094 TaxID=1392246 RepID=A0A6A5W7H3_9PLEO|nr:hypothetical protein P154DRAFT_623547 [Amniculicola lignicola CBS 123094]